MIRGKVAMFYAHIAFVSDSESDDSSFPHRGPYVFSSQCRGAVTAICLIDEWKIIACC